MAKPMTREEEAAMWAELEEKLANGFRPKFCYANKATLESAFKKPQFEVIRQI